MNGEDAMISALFIDLRDFTPSPTGDGPPGGHAAERVLRGRRSGPRGARRPRAAVPRRRDARRVRRPRAARRPRRPRRRRRACDRHRGRRPLRRPLPRSIGVNSGLVLVATIGGGSRSDLGIIGDPVNVAARVEQATRCTGDACSSPRRPVACSRATGSSRAAPSSSRASPRRSRSTRWERCDEAPLPLVLWILAVAAMLPAAGDQRGTRSGATTLDLVANVGFTLLILGAATTAGVVATRVPANAIGWDAARARPRARGPGCSPAPMPRQGPAPRRRVDGLAGQLAPARGAVRRDGRTAAAVPRRPARVAPLAAGRLGPVRSGWRWRGSDRHSIRGRSARPSCRTRSAPRGPRTKLVRDLTAVTDVLACWRCRCCWRRPPRWSCASAARAASSGCS